MTYLDAIDWLCDARREGDVPAEVVAAIVDTHAQIANDALVHQLVKDAEANTAKALAERDRANDRLVEVYYKQALSQRYVPIDADIIGPCDCVECPEQDPS